MHSCLKGAYWDGLATIPFICTRSGHAASYCPCQYPVTCAYHAGCRRIVSACTKMAILQCNCVYFRRTNTKPTWSVNFSMSMYLSTIPFFIVGKQKWHSHFNKTWKHLVSGSFCHSFFKLLSLKRKKQKQLWSPFFFAFSVMKSQWEAQFPFLIYQTKNTKPNILNPTFVSAFFKES